MSLIELDISASPEAVFGRIGSTAGAFWIDGRRDGGGSFMASAPEAQLLLRGDGTVELLRGGERRTPRGDPLRLLEEFVGDAAPLGGDAPRTVGFFAYDLVGLLEPRVRPRRDPLCVLPLAGLARYDAVVELLRDDDDDDARRPIGVRIHATSARAAERCARRLRDASESPRGSGAAAGRGDHAACLLEAPCASTHRAAIERALAYIAAGDVYQVNLAQRLRVRSPIAPHEAYLRLRAAQRVPFGAYLAFADFAVLCGSPERFLRVAGSDVTTEPIKGTRPRGTDGARDAALRAELRADPKERAEHVMIVDLERNDLGRSCVTGSVRVPSLMRVESFATLHHMVSTVRGTLRTEVGLADLLRASFPGGSVTGAPKIRAAQVIAELEAAPREIYTGALAWFRGPRDFDSAIAIRTAVARDGVFTYHAGGGIVADSDPAREYDECLLKAEPFLRALGVASQAVRAPSASGGDHATRRHA
jgi:para-aminobenzoate synthetase component 1